jgi:hypothetical protein
LQRILNTIQALNASAHSEKDRTMGRLTGYLQARFREHCPPDWECGSEARLLGKELAKILGYAPRSDVVLTNCSSRARLWIEFEVSRADPVANHAKFATAHLFQPQVPNDVFVSMVSRHVDRGRRNLAANTIRLMRRVGMQAIQTILFPTLNGPEVQRFNQMSASDLAKGGPDVRPEIERVFAVTTPQGTAGDHRIFLAAEIVDVLLNAQAWNREVATPAGRKQWGRRRVQYFVGVPYSEEFAPCKFCAFLPIIQPGHSTPDGDSSRMTLHLYVQLDESEPRFDGNVAQRHLTNRLGMVPATPDVHPHVFEQFKEWLASVEDLITVPPKGATILVPPET